MDFKLVSKNNLGTVVLLLLVIGLSQARSFDFLIDTALGRFFLILFILYLSYCNKILGIVGVLFIIIMFNGNVYYEGATTMNSTVPTPPSGQIPPSVPIMPPSIPMPVPVKTIPFQESVLTKLQDQMRLLDTNLIVTNSKIEEAKLNARNKNKNKNNTSAAEGFDILGIENDIKRGKQSNSIQVNDLMRDSDSVLPYEGSSFLGIFSPF